MSACDLYRPQLSEYIDGTLADEARDPLEVHVATCADCRGIIADLERVRAAARRLGPIAPPARVWEAIAATTTTAPSSTTSAVTTSERWQWMGLAAALLLVTFGMYAIARPDGGAPTATPPQAGNATDAPTVETIQESFARAQAAYEKAIADLEKMVESGKGNLSPGTAETLLKNASTMDTAIAETQAALKVDPESQPARTSLFEALRRKVTMLQDTVVLMNEMRKGNESGAAEAAGGLGKQG